MDYDIAIIGAGPAGLSFALSLQQSGLKVVVIEKQQQEMLSSPPYDGREIALTHLSKKLMSQHGSWDNLGADNIHPLNAASVLNGRSDYQLNFDTPSGGNEPLGYLVSNQQIRRSVYAAFSDSKAATLIDGVSVTRIHTDDSGGYLTLSDGRAISASLIVAADTRFSEARRQMGIAADLNDYGRSALLCVMEHEKPHEHKALECFLYGGTLAVLPLNEHTSSIVITVNSAQVSNLLNMNEAAFNQEITNRVGLRLGKMKQRGERYHYPLVGVHAKRFYSQRFALIGDAAVGMHPVTAHGFNLGLSGQDLLASEILKAHQKQLPIWSDAVLQAYQSRHMPNTRLLYHGTNTVVALFTDDRLPARLLRKAVLRVSNHLPPLKQAIRQKLMNTKHPSMRLL